MSIPIPALKTAVRNGQMHVWDLVRRKWVLLTPEEQVRQGMIHYLHKELGFPISWMAVEKQLMLYGQKKRFDILIYQNGLTPWMMVECKAPQIPITPSVFDQIARYNLTLKVPVLIVTNGSTTYCAQIDNENQMVNWLENIPKLSL
jgi:hypothetical protein